MPFFMKNIKVFLRSHSKIKQLCANAVERQLDVIGASLTISPLHLIIYICEYFFVILFIYSFALRLAVLAILSARKCNWICIIDMCNFISTTFNLISSLCA